YSWNFGDGSSPGSGVAPGHSYVTAGSYTVTLAVSDGLAGPVSATATVTVSEPGGGNQPPVADAGGPYSGQSGSSIVFDGSASFDADGDALTYSWDFGDGSSPGSGVAPSHSYVMAGGYTA